MITTASGEKMCLQTLIWAFTVCLRTDGFIEYINGQQRSRGDIGCTALRKLAYSNVLKILPPKNENFQRKKSDIFRISAQNIDCGYTLEPPWRGGSNAYPQSMF